jgi:methionine-S-sulfoxide reductase
MYVIPQSLIPLLALVALGTALAMLALREAGVLASPHPSGSRTDEAPRTKPAIDRSSPSDMQVATFALGCFWGPEARFGVMRGVVRVRVGYAGGSTRAPTYEDLRDHSEAIQVEFDPTQLSYEELLEAFWSSHDPAYRHWSPRYASVVFFHDQRQERLALESRDRWAKRLSGNILTGIVPFSRFHTAEVQQQRHYLRQVPALLTEFEQIYPEAAAFVASTAVMRANGYLGGYGTAAALKSDLGKLGLSREGGQRLLSQWKPHSIGTEAQGYSLEDLSETPIEP